MTHVSPIPALVGGLVVGFESTIEWALWPIEVHTTGCLLRIRLAPLGKWREYYDFRTLAATVQLVKGLEHERIVVSSPAGELILSSSRLPTAGPDPTSWEPWDHTWTLAFWWPHEHWGGALSLRWPDRGLSVELPIDVDALHAARRSLEDNEVCSPSAGA